MHWNEALNLWTFGFGCTWHVLQKKSEINCSIEIDDLWRKISPPYIVISLMSSKPGYILIDKVSQPRLYIGKHGCGQELRDKLGSISWHTVPTYLIFRHLKSSWRLSYFPLNFRNLWVFKWLTNDEVLFLIKILSFISLFITWKLPASTVVMKCDNCQSKAFSETFLLWVHASNSALIWYSRNMKLK